LIATERFNERNGSTGAGVCIASGGGDYGVAEYRAYTVGRDGHFIGFEPLVCANDAEAIEQAKRLVVNHAIELWSGVRLVVRLEAKTT
jgi:hypothetical protein